MHSILYHIYITLYNIIWYYIILYNILIWIQSGQHCPSLKEDKYLLHLRTHHVRPPLHGWDHNATILYHLAQQQTVGSGKIPESQHMADDIADISWSCFGLQPSHLRAEWHSVNGSEWVYTVYTVYWRKPGFLFPKTFIGKETFCKNWVDGWPCESRLMSRNTWSPYSLKRVG